MHLMEHDLAVQHLKFGFRTVDWSGDLATKWCTDFRDLNYLFFRFFKFQVQAYCFEQWSSTNLWNDQARSSSLELLSQNGQAGSSKKEHKINNSLDIHLILQKLVVNKFDKHNQVRKSLFELDDRNGNATC